MFRLRLFALLAGTFCLVASESPGQTPATPAPAAPAGGPASPAPAAGQDAAQSAAALEAWQKLVAQRPSVDPPAAWKQKEPSREEVEAWLGPERQRLLRLAEEAFAFAHQYAGNPNAPAAWQMTTQALFAANQLGSAEASERLAMVDAAHLQQPWLTAQDRFRIRLRQVQMAAENAMREAQAQADAARGAGDPLAAKTAESLLARAQAEVRKGSAEEARKLHREFPSEPEPLAILIELAGDAEDAEGRALLQEVAGDTSAPESIRERARGILRRAEALGKKLDLQFTALDGRKIDVKNYAGRVLLIDFWATWCGPCVASLPDLHATYATLKEAKFEVIGISFDRDRAKLEAFLKEKEMTWPQYFDGKYWANEIGRRYGIASIPTMWLVDKHGVLRDLHADVNLQQKVKALLAEKE